MSLYSHYLEMTKFIYINTYKNKNKNDKVKPLQIQ